MKQKTFLSKSVIILITMIIAISLILCFFVFNQQANAEMPIWDKIDYEEFFGTEEYTGFTGYAIRTDNTFLNKYRYFYVFASSAGGMGGSSDDDNGAYGGGAGGMVAVKIDNYLINCLIFFVGKGGGTFNDESNGVPYGDGYETVIIALYSNGTDIRASGATCYGGKAGNNTEPGKGGTWQIDNRSGFMTTLYGQNGADGGQSSPHFSVDLGFRTQHFIFRPSGINLSGKGGGASAFNSGGNGGMISTKGANGTKGAGGGGAGKGTNQGGFGGDGYVELYGSNM